MSLIKRHILSVISSFSLLFVSAGFSLSTDGSLSKATVENKIITIPCGMVNCFLVVGSDQCILVDTGGVNSLKKLFDAIKNYNVKLIVLTHGHYDHTQNAAYIAEKLGAKIAINSDDYDLIINPQAHKTYGRTVVQKISSFFSTTMGSFIKIDPFVPDLMLSGGQSLAEYGIDGTIVELGGHTKGSIGILLNNGKDFIVGDAKMNFLTMSEPFLFEDYDLLMSSMKIIENSAAENIYFGHGKPITSSNIRINS